MQKEEIVDRLAGARLAERNPSPEGPGALSGFPSDRYEALLDRRHAEGLLPPRREALLRARNDGGSR